MMQEISNLVFVLLDSLNKEIIVSMVLPSESRIIEFQKIIWSIILPFCRGKTDKENGGWYCNFWVGVVVWM